MRDLIKFIAFTLLLGIPAFPIVAFASSSSDASIAGEGAVPFSGWEISNLDYQLAYNSSFIESVTFEMDAPADHVSVKVNSGYRQFTVSRNKGGYFWQCCFQPGVKVSSMDEYHIVAVGN